MFRFVQDDATGNGRDIKNKYFSIYFYYYSYFFFANSQDANLTKRTPGFFSVFRCINIHHWKNSDQLRGIDVGSRAYRYFLKLMSRKKLIKNFSSCISRRINSIRRSTRDGTGVERFYGTSGSGTVFWGTLRFAGA